MKKYKINIPAGEAQEVLYAITRIPHKYSLCVPELGYVGAINDIDDKFEQDFISVRKQLFKKDTLLSNESIIDLADEKIIISADENEIVSEVVSNGDKINDKRGDSRKKSKVSKSTKKLEK